MSALLFFHVLVAMAVVGSLIAAATAAWFELWGIVRGTTIAAVVGTIAAIGLGEGLAADEDVHAGWLDASRGLAVLGLLGAAVVVVLATLARTRRGLKRPTAATALALVLIGLATAFLMAAKPA
jgi:hypothetical protein